MVLVALSTKKQSVPKNLKFLKENFLWETFFVTPCIFRPHNNSYEVLFRVSESLPLSYSLKQIFFSDIRVLQLSKLRSEENLIFIWQDGFICPPFFRVEPCQSGLDFVLFQLRCKIILNNKYVNKLTSIAFHFWHLVLQIKDVVISVDRLTVPSVKICLVLLLF